MLEKDFKDVKIFSIKRQSQNLLIWIDQPHESSLTLVKISCRMTHTESPCKVGCRCHEPLGQSPVRIVLHSAPTQQGLASCRPANQ